MNEHIKSTWHFMGPVYEKLFNIILASWALPEVRSAGLIKPIYKKGGRGRREKSNPENYRPITLVSCLGKLFTGILSSRLYTYAEQSDVLTSSQAGFIKVHSTTDQILDIESDYKYLVVLFGKSWSFYSAKNQAENAMYSLVRKSRSLILPLDLQIELYEKMVKPILFYGSEVWSFGNLDVLKRSVLKFVKLILYMKSSNPILWCMEKQGFIRFI